MTGGKPFSRRQRLLKAAEFEAVFVHRCSWRSPLFIVLACPNTEGIARLGMVVSKKLLQRSIDRNRIRRGIREEFRQVAANLPALDLVVRLLAKPDFNNQADFQAGSYPTETWREDLRQALVKAVEKCGS